MDKIIKMKRLRQVESFEVGILVSERMRRSGENKDRRAFRSRTVEREARPRQFQARAIIAPVEAGTLAASTGELLSTTKSER